MQQVARVASGYVYYVSLKGVTGAGHLDTDAVEQALPRIRKHVKIPVGVGFGIRDAATAKAIGKVADAVVIGTRIIQLMEDQPRERWCRPWPPSCGKSAPRWTHKTLSRNPRMSWLGKTAAPQDPADGPERAPQVPEGLWIKCPSCETVLYKTDLEQNQNVCPTCSHHHRIGARGRLNAFLDAEGRYEIGQEVLPVDALCSRTAGAIPSG